MSIDKEERKLVEKETKIFSKKDYEKCKCGRTGKTEYWVKKKSNHHDT